MAATLVPADARVFVLPATRAFVLETSRMPRSNAFISVYERYERLVMVI